MIQVKKYSHLLGEDINRSHERRLPDELLDRSVLTNSIHPENKYSTKDSIDRLLERDLDAVNNGLASSGRIPLTNLLISIVQVKW
jgi:hypothetical protein